VRRQNPNRVGREAYPTGPYNRIMCNWGITRRRLFLPALLLVLPALYADNPQTQLKIQVKTQSGKPVDRASVIVRFLGNRNIVKLGRRDRTVWETRTNQEGEAPIPSIPQGKIRIQVIAKGYQTFGQDFEINEDEKTVPITLNPPQQQYSAH